jgi:ASC-1-like (ASCH) protein
MSNSEIRRQLEKGDSLAFEKTDLYQQVFALAEQKSGRRTESHPAGYQLEPEDHA